ncbi:hypothetical protein [Paraburkholderia rhynchosiae]|uniref:MerR family transcriptional regulator n=1 Tax=Paraburkholderia rhynchosiae TaxID=487049 RepID=A0A2N7WBQ7_9BURK|nr:hypothetical protein [Paraburkholderia rhynchosiae]PMS26824.1 hypothetical protein C0Z16_26495 [Paraburkholderia rhynchosiae]CAB3728274.1 hypothetical protein LMG27174_05562 [Paraburkholderia rhynchosiae]
MVTLIDLEIAHLERVMGASMAGDLAGPILPGAYWRERLHELLDGQHLTNAQLRSLDVLLLQLDELEAQASNSAPQRTTVSTS